VDAFFPLEYLVSSKEHKETIDYISSRLT